MSSRFTTRGNPNVYIFEENVGVATLSDHQHSRATTHIIDDVLVADINCQLGNAFSFRFQPSSLEPMFFAVRLYNNTAAPHRFQPTVFENTAAPISQSTPSFETQESIASSTAPAHAESFPLSQSLVPDTASSHVPQHHLPENAPSAAQNISRTPQSTRYASEPPGMASDRIALPLKRPYILATFVEPTPSVILPSWYHPTHPRDSDDPPYRYRISHSRLPQHADYLEPSTFVRAYRQDTTPPPMPRFDKESSLMRALRQAQEQQTLAVGAAATPAVIKTEHDTEDRTLLNTENPEHNKSPHDVSHSASAARRSPSLSSPSPSQLRAPLLLYSPPQAPGIYLGHGSPRLSLKRKASDLQDGKDHDEKENDDGHRESQQSRST
ncbi:hypothetical protein CONPUDRAFT_152635 [Coniophora puteana RWD-64-598 SS2]|uniref:Uncharacterized protein n=1 Tax=Coniophora puteana (strain RWD-64-598) TaxID=741705 RepID=A0A5M3MT72_CONPW|nr:uncharacterized protein CONPUDRAFT_152635 [Coniophora puteana RWD-64-598 SS2]EIW81721.1 hypothetical protein CONPUDRAFT_152635 [Coniophora puteana RWD-64-598 SS2]